MAQFSFKNGIMTFPDGTTWDSTTQALPPDPATFNATPTGNPLQPQTLPRVIQAAQMDASPSVAPAVPLGMFGSQPSSMQASPVTAQAQNVPHPSFLGQGGVGRSIAGAIGDALLAANHIQPIYAPARQNELAMRRQAYQQALEFNRQAALQQMKPPETGSIEKNYNFLKSVDPSLAASYARAEANPQQLVTDPETGFTRFVSKGGNPTPSKTINGKTYYYVNGDWYDNPEGK